MSSFNSSSIGGARLPSADRPSRGTGRATTAGLTASRPKPNLRKVLPDVWRLVKPRRWLLAGSFVLMVLNRASGLVLPTSTRYLVDDVMMKRQMHLLPIIVGVVVAATILQGLTSFALTQVLSKAGQRLIAELRTEVQSHIGRLPVAFYDENRTGTLVARIMTDVEGVRNLIGTGVIDLFGGIFTAVFAFGYLIHLNVQMTLLTFVILFLFGIILQRAFKNHPADLSRAVPRSMPRSPAGSPNRSVACASSRATTPSRVRLTSSRAGRNGCSRMWCRHSPLSRS